MTHQARSSRYARNAFANWLNVAFLAVVSFFLSPFLVQHLGATRYGVWSLTAGLVGYLGLLDLGIRQAVSHYVARHHAASAHQECSLIVSAALRLFGFLGILAIFVSGALAYFTPIIFNIPEALTDDVRTIVVLGGLGIALSLIGGVFGGVVTGIERFDIQAGVEIVLTTVRTIGIVLALREGYGLVALAGIQLSTSILGCIVYWAAARKLYAELRIQLRGALSPQMRTIVSFSASMTVLIVLGRVLYYSDTAVIAAFLPIDAVTYFVIAGSLCSYAKEMPRSLAYLMAPRVSALTSTGGNRVGEEILEVARIATLASTPIAITFLFRGESFISLWMGPAYGPLAGEVLRVLAIAVWLDASRSVLGNSLVGMAKQRTLIPGVAVEAVCNLVLSIILVRYLGIVGVALGTVIPGALVSLAYFPRCLSKATDAPQSLFFRKGLLVPTFACLPFGLATAAIEQFMPATNLAVFFLQVILILPLVPATAWFVCLSIAEKEKVKSVIRKTIDR